MCSETTKEELFHKFANDLWDNQTPPNLEFDNIIHDNIWELYTHGFPKQTITDIGAIAQSGEL